MQKPGNSSIINICVIPNENVSTNCLSISQSLKSDDTVFVLGGDKFAHMTAFMARFPNKDIEKVIHNVNLVLARVEPFRCEHVGYFMTEGRYLEVSYKKSEKFMSLHESLISAVSELRINPGRPYEEGYFTPYTMEQRLNAKETGYDLARNLYRPHITLTRYKENLVPNLFPAFPQVDLSFDIYKVCVYKADYNGAVYEKLSEYIIN